MHTTPAHADLNTLLNTAQSICDGVDEILLRGYGLGVVSQKADGSLVTQIDHAADEFITTHLAAAYPDHAILSEERNTMYSPAVDFTWVIDPLDGTTNFARGIPIWGVSIALLFRGVPILGVLGFVSLHERYVAQLGTGATRNGVPVHTASNVAIDDQHFLMLCTRTSKQYKISSPLKPRILGSAAYHLATVASGSALAGIESTPKIWDVAAALLILSEAGGSYRMLGDNSTGKSIFPLESQQQDFEHISLPLLVAANEDILVEMESRIERRKQ